MRIPLATDLKTRTGAPSGKDARLVNSYIETRGDQSVVRKRPIAQGGVSIGTGIAQGGINFNGLFLMNGDVLSPYTGGGTNWNSVITYNIGDNVSVGFVNYWANTSNTNSQPPNANWSTTFVPPPPVTYATWSSHTAGSTLSNGNKTITGSAFGAFSDISKSSGKWYWEYIIGSTFDVVVDVIGVGIGNTGAILGNLGAEIHSWGYFSGNNFPVSNIKMFNSIPAIYGSVYITGSVIGVALDMDGGNLTFYVNGVSQGVAYSGITGSCFADVYFNQGLTNICSITANFGATPLTYTPPAGYNAGLYQ